MRVIVTGGAGFIGRHLVQALDALGYEILVVDDGSHSDPLLSTSDRITVARQSILDRNLTQLFCSFRPDNVFHLAAQISVSHSVTDPVGDAAANIEGSLRVFEACKRAHVKKLVMTSSGGALYGECAGGQATEQTTVNPKSPYGISKLAAEMYMRWYVDNDAFDGTVLRLANVYGPGQGAGGEAGVIALFCQKLMAKEPVFIYGDGEQTRDFVYVGCVVDALLTAMSTPRAFGPFNIASGRGVTVNDIVSVLQRELETQEAVTHRPARASEVRHSRLDATRAKQELGWHSTLQLEDGITTVIDEIRSDQSQSERRQKA